MMLVNHQNRALEPGERSGKSRRKLYMICSCDDIYMIISGEISLFCVFSLFIFLMKYKKAKAALKLFKEGKKIKEVIS
jgi:hypothetical protein